MATVKISLDASGERDAARMLARRLREMEMRSRALPSTDVHIALIASIAAELEGVGGSSESGEGEGEEG